MRSLRIFVWLSVLAVSGGVAEAEVASGATSGTGWVTKWTAAKSSLRDTRLDDLSAKNLKKTADLQSPMEVEVLSLGREVDGLEFMKERLVDVRISNPNPYSVFFQGRHYMGNRTILAGWNKLKDGKWMLAGWDGCGTHVRDWDIEAGGKVEVLLVMQPDMKEQQVLGRFYKMDQPSVQSECLLYEVRR